MIYERPPTLEQLERLAKKDKATEQDLINAHLLMKLAQLEAKINESDTKGDSGDLL